MAISPSTNPKNPPKVPKGWVAQFDDKYLTWFYVNLDTKKSQWEAPEGTTFKPEHDKDDVQPPRYEPPGTSSSMGKTSNNTFSGGGGHYDAVGQPGPYCGPGYGGYGSFPQGNYPPRGSYQPNYPQQAGYASQGYAGYPPQGFGGYPQQAYGACTPQMGYPTQGYGYQQAPQKNSRFGGGTGMAMGAGAGLLGGLLISDAIHDSQMNAYEQGYDNGYDNGYDGGFGGGDFDGGGF